MGFTRVLHLSITSLDTSTEHPAFERLLLLLYAFTMALPIHGSYTDSCFGGVERIGRKVERDLPGSLPDIISIHRKYRIPLLMGSPLPSPLGWTGALAQSAISLGYKATALFLRTQPILRPLTSVETPVHRRALASTASTLCLLPQELLLQIIYHLGPGSLYLLRQTSFFFRVLLDDELMHRKYFGNDISGVLPPFHPATMTVQELQDLARILQQGLI